MSNYIKQARPAHENEHCQLHLAAEGMQPGTWEFRRLYVLADQGDIADADKAEETFMRKLDLDEIVLEVPVWSQFFVKKRPGTEERTVHKIEEATVTGMHFSEDAIKGRVLVIIAGSRSTVKEGTEEEGDVFLRGIEGQSVGTAGFKKIGDAKSLNLNRLKEPFDGDRLTPERWSYVGASGIGRPSKRPRQPSV